MDLETFEQTAVEALESAEKDGWSLLEDLGKTSEDVRKDGITLEWAVGGVEGYSYLESSRGYGVDTETEPDDVHLDAILMWVAPSLPFHQYKALRKSIITRTERRQNEYYGNYVDYARKTFTLQDLYEHLQTLGALRGD